MTGRLSVDDNWQTQSGAINWTGLAQLFEMSEVAEEITIPPPPHSPGRASVSVIMHFICVLTDLPDCILRANEVVAAPAAPAPALWNTGPERMPHLRRQL